MLAFIKKTIGISSDTEEQCSCCGSETAVEKLPSRSQCGCGENLELPESSPESDKG